MDNINIAKLQQQAFDGISADDTIRQKTAGKLPKFSALLLIGALFIGSTAGKAQAGPIGKIIKGAAVATVVVAGAKIVQHQAGVKSNDITHNYGTASQDNPSTLFHVEQAQSSYANIVPTNVINALKGNTGGKDPSSIPAAKNALDQTFNALVEKYGELYDATQSYSETQQKFSGSANYKKAMSGGAAGDQFRAKIEEGRDNKEIKADNTPRAQALNDASGKLKEADKKFKAALQSFSNVATIAVREDKLNVHAYDAVLSMASGIKAPSVNGTQNVIRSKIANQIRF